MYNLYHPGSQNDYMGVETPVNLDAPWAVYRSKNKILYEQETNSYMFEHFYTLGPIH